jgi:hypothetical protein
MFHAQLFGRIALKMVVAAILVVGHNQVAYPQFNAICTCGCGKKIGACCPQAQCQARAETFRKHIRSVAKNVLKSQGRRLVVTSGFRANSQAHMVGAIDISSKDLTPKVRHADAREISRRLGARFRVVVEELDPITKTQTNTTYQGGIKGKTRVGLPIKATATHTHIQPVLSSK